MARKVYISSDMSVDEDLSDIAEEDGILALLWPWFLTAFDDWGRAEASPKRLKNLIFPANELITIDTIKKALQLYNGRLITLYELNEKWYMYIYPEKWFKYQTHIRGDKRENDKSKYPAPPANSAQVRASARDSAESSADGVNRADTDSIGRAQMREDARDCTPSPSLSLSPSLSKDSSGSSMTGQNPFALFEKHGFGKLEEITAQFIEDCITTFTEDWVKRAMVEAVKHGIKTWAYVEGILKRWKATGHPEPWTLEKEEPKQQQSFRSYSRPQSPKLGVVKDDGNAPEVTPEQMEQMMERARRLKGESA